MGRSVGLPLLLVSLVIGGVLFAMQMKSEGPTSPAVTQAETQAVVAAAGTNFQAADQAMANWLADHGTYAGATLDPSYMVTVARADASRARGRSRRISGARRLLSRPGNPGSPR